MRPVQARHDSWGVDFSSKCTPQIIQQLKAAKYQVKDLHGNVTSEVPIEFIFRYVSLGSPSPADITADEAKLITDSGFLLGLVQHVKYPGWLANGPLGTALGTNASRHASGVGYPDQCHLGLDDEGVNSASTPAEVTSYIIQWAHALTCQPMLYVGYQCGLSPDQLWSIPNVHLYWSDYGPRVVPHRGFAIKQYDTKFLPGVSIPIDMDHIKTDDMGGLPMLAAA